jgi:hypothetical protein
MLRPTASNPNQPEVINSQVRLPRGIYAARIQKCELKQSTKGNPMFVVTWELCKALVDGQWKDTVSVAGKHYAIGGVKLKPEYYTLTAEAVYRLFKLQEILGLDQRVDPENPGEVAMELEGKVANVVAGSNEYVMRGDLTEEEIAAGKKPQDAEPLKREDGSTIKGYERVIISVDSKSSVVMPVA